MFGTASPYDLLRETDEDVILALRAINKAAAQELKAVQERQAVLIAMRVGELLKPS